MKLSHPNNFGDRLRELREVKGVTLEELAEELDVSPSYVSHLERGKSVSASKVFEVATALGLETVRIDGLIARLMARNYDCVDVWPAFGQAAVTVRQRIEEKREGSD